MLHSDAATFAFYDNQFFDVGHTAWLASPITARKWEYRMKKKCEPHPDDSNCRESFAVHPNWTLFGQNAHGERLKEIITLSDVEALLTGRLVLDCAEKEMLMDNLIRVLQGPPNKAEVGQALMDIIDGFHYLAVAGNCDDFFKKVFGWDARVSHRVMEAYRAGRWDTMVAPDFCLDEAAIQPAPRRYAPDAKTPPRAQTRRGQHAGAIIRPIRQNNEQAKIDEPCWQHSLRSDESIKLLRAFGPKFETFRILDAETLWQWAEDTRRQYDLLQRALAGLAQLSIVGMKVREEAPPPVAP